MQEEILEDVFHHALADRRGPGRLRQDGLAERRCRLEKIDSGEDLRQAVPEMGRMAVAEDQIAGPLAVLVDSRRRGRAERRGPYRGNSFPGGKPLLVWS